MIVAATSSRGTELGLQAGSPPILHVESRGRCRRSAARALRRSATPVADSTAEMPATDRPRPIASTEAPEALQSSSGRKMWSATQAAQMSALDSRSPSGSGRRRSGYRQLTSYEASPLALEAAQAPERAAAGSAAPSTGPTTGSGSVTRSGRAIRSLGPPRGREANIAGGVTTSLRKVLDCPASAVRTDSASPTGRNCRCSGDGVDARGNSNGERERRPDFRPTEDALGRARPRRRSRSGPAATRP